MAELITIVVAIASLAWAIWSYQRSRAQVRVWCEPCVLESGPGMTFTREGSTERTPLKPGELSQLLLEIRARNLGPSTVAIEKMYVRLRSQWREAPNVPLVNCWILVEDEHRVPAVLAPGAFWCGTCDFGWLELKLEQLYGPRPVWDLAVRLIDAGNGRRYAGEVQLSSAVYAQIRDRMHHRHANPNEVLQPRGQTPNPAAQPDLRRTDGRRARG